MLSTSISPRRGSRFCHPGKENSWGRPVACGRRIRRPLSTCKAGPMGPAQARAPAPQRTLALRRRPDYALILLRHRRHAFVDELLDALALEGLGRVDVALGIDGDAVHAEEFARDAPAVAEGRQNFHGRAVHDVHFLVLAIGE